MFEMRINVGDVEQLAKELDGVMDQMPFALSVALNDAVRETRTVLTQDTWPRHVHVRNTGFISRALRTVFAKKEYLRVEIYDDLGRAHLELHAKGGTKQAKSRFAIPTRGVVRGPSGVRISQLPANLKRKVVKNGMIFQATGRGKNSKLRLMYKLRETTDQPKDVPFYEDFDFVMRQGLRTSLPAAMARAMKSRRR